MTGIRTANTNSSMNHELQDTENQTDANSAIAISDLQKNARRTAESHAGH